MNVSYEIVTNEVIWIISITLWNLLYLNNEK